MSRQLTCLLPIMMFLLLAAGCASPWEKHFQPNPMLQRKFSPVQQVEVRTVEFERLQKYEEFEHKHRVESTTSPADYTQEERLAAKNRLLAALQLRERGDEIEILGWSRFSDTEPLNPGDPKLVKFAREIGADVVIVSSAFAGQVNRVVDYPLTSYSNYYTSVVGPGGRRNTLYSGSSQSTVWVPTTVTENEYYYEAIFLRRAPGQSPKATTGP